MAPSRVSASTLGPSVSPPADSSPYEVRPASRPVCAAACSRAGPTTASIPGPKPAGCGPCTSAKALRPSSVRKAGASPPAVPPVAGPTMRACGTCTRTASNTAWMSSARAVALWPGGTVTTGTSVSKVPAPNSATSCCSASNPGWPGSEKSKVSRLVTVLAAAAPARNSTSQMP